MKIILLEKIEKLGQLGDIVNVKTGYARNFLLPAEKAQQMKILNILSQKLLKSERKMTKTWLMPPNYLKA